MSETFATRAEHRQAAQRVVARMRREFEVNDNPGTMTDLVEAIVALTDAVLSLPTSTS